MKKVIAFAFLLFFGTLTINAQKVRLGVKAGINFSNIDGETNMKTKTGLHFGGILEINTSRNFFLQPEFLYSSQGAKANGKGAVDIDYKYLSVPVVGKFYVIQDVLSLEAGPQFSFLIKDDITKSNQSTFDFAVLGGLGINFTDNVFGQARYVVGITDTKDDTKITNNKVLQFSVGYRF